MSFPQMYFPLRAPGREATEKPLKFPPTMLIALQHLLDPVTYSKIEKALVVGLSTIPQSVSTMATVCNKFNLKYPGEPMNDDFDDPLELLRPRVEWEVPDANLEDWLHSELSPEGIDIKSRLTAAISDAAQLPKFFYMYQRTVERQDEAASRALVDQILMTALSILQGVEQDYIQFKETRQVSPDTIGANITSSTTAPGPASNAPSGIPAHKREETPNRFNCLRLQFEADMIYTDQKTHKPHIGRVDWVIGYPTLISTTSASSPTLACSAALIVTKAKAPVLFHRAAAQVMAYTACLYRARERWGFRSDLSTYGVATDGMQWQFFRISPDPSGSTSARAIVSETQIFKVCRNNLRIILSHIIFIIIRAMQTSAPANSASDKSNITSGQEPNRPTTTSTNTADSDTQLDTTAAGLVETQESEPPTEDGTEEDEYDQSPEKSDSGSILCK